MRPASFLRGWGGGKEAGGRFMYKSRSARTDRTVAAGWDDGVVAYRRSAIDCSVTLGSQSNVCAFLRAELGREQCYSSMSILLPQDDGPRVV
jgi:hypothetical protein